MRTSFYTYFSSAYSTLWLIMFAIAFLTTSHVDAGVFGVIGFPIISAIYAFMRRTNDKHKLPPGNVLSPKPES
jgi:hypothetical protein